MDSDMQDYEDNVVEDIWETFAVVQNKKCRAGNVRRTKFDCCADWEFQVKRAPKTDKNREVIELMGKGAQKIENPSLMFVFQKSCWVNKIQFLEDFQELNNIGPILWYSRIRNDGNCIQGIFEDAGNFYTIWFCGS